ncbi:MAG: tRNA uridine-5-carboxymethylaminomethyl(34) synthesis enzyme MnmG [Desulfatibacillaceae bacterium]|nr:tRNA uridine-5-carboxymethylaminomethyl(34) synthesis enzyme MnmG [Desulfatibacillaceae bacterium]
MGANEKFDCIVVGAGHAGCEAALAAARMGCRVLLTVINLDTLAAMPCSPSIGGTGKGQLVKEIDALGGAMGKIADRTAISFRTLNTRKGPAVQSTRTQNDKHSYSRAMSRLVALTPNITLRQTQVKRLVVEDSRIVGVEDAIGCGYAAPSVVLATGTFLSGIIHIGHNSFRAGRAGEFASYDLAESLKNLGFEMGRMKTGTPARLLRKSIDFSRCEQVEQDEAPSPFSLLTQKLDLPFLPSFMTHTNSRTHGIIRENLARSALYGGIVKGVSARYCPSLEDKVVRFSERERHSVILEPEGIESEEIYASGLGNSLPFEVQVELVHSVAGLEEAVIMRPAYAIEYDFLDPCQLLPTLETKAVRGLFCAGQINGTSGYEEAAAQGLWAGINAACQVQGRAPFVLDRSQAYSAVMVDDLVTRGTREPYRMFTSRAEYRLLLREDNADLRLAAIGHELGLVDRETLKDVTDRAAQANAEMARLEKAIIKPGPVVDALLAQRGEGPLAQPQPLSQILKRSGVDYKTASALSPPPEPLSPKAARQVEITIKYEGYIARQKKEVERFAAMEKKRLPKDFDYQKVAGLSLELREKLSRIRPASLGQASRVEGMTPSAIAALAVKLRQKDSLKS